MAGKRKAEEEANKEDGKLGTAISCPCHVHLLAINLSAIQPASSSSSSCKWILPQSSGAAMAISKVEAMGIVVDVCRKEKYLRFLLDDGSGSCIPCILWLNLLTLPPRSFVIHPHYIISTQVRADVSLEEASKVALGSLIRVQGRLSFFNRIQITVSSLQIESDPNAEIAHWLDCMRLALHCYDLRRRT